MLFSPKLIYKSNTVLIKIPRGIFVESDELITKFLWKGKEPRIAKILLKENTAGNLPNSNTYKVTVINPVWWYWLMEGPMEHKKEFRNRPVHICKFNFYNFCNL